MRRHTRVKTSRGKTRMYLEHSALGDLPKAYRAKLEVTKTRRTPQTKPHMTVLAWQDKLHKGYTVFTRADSPLKPKH